MTNTSDKIILGVLFLLLVVVSSVFITAFSSDTSAQQTSSQNFINEISPDEAKAIALREVPGTLKDFEIETEFGQKIYDIEIKSGNLIQDVTIDLQGNILKVEVEEEDVPITGTSLERASQAALDRIGEGRVTDTEIGDEEGYYEIEITLDNGEEADVHLDKDFNVLSVEYD